MPRKVWKYAGVGARLTPPPILDQMTAIAVELEHWDFTLVSGGALGADEAFEAGVRSAKHKEIYLPWKGFNGREDGIFPPEKWTYGSIYHYHPNPGAVFNNSKGAKHLLARNAHQILGKDGSQPVDAVVCWTPGGEDVGGTGHALRIARLNGIPVINLFHFENKTEEALYTILVETGYW